MRQNERSDFMPMKVKNEAGEDIEVPTQEEIDALAQQRADEAAEAARKEALETAQAEKEELEERLKKLEDKEYNFSQLRKNKDKESEEAKALAKQLEEVNQRLSKVETQPFEKAKSDFIGSNGIAGDKDLKEKFEHFLEPLAKTAKSEADYKAALAGAFAAATGGTKQPTFDGMMVSTRVTPPSSGGNPQSEAHRTFSSAFGLSETDHKKYGKKSN